MLLHLVLYCWCAVGSRPVYCSCTAVYLPPAGLLVLRPQAASAAAYSMLDMAMRTVPGFDYKLAEEVEGFHENAATLLPLHR
jgi:hypothetical protein